MSRMCSGRLKCSDKIPDSSLQQVFSSRPEEEEEEEEGRLLFEVLELFKYGIPDVPRNTLELFLENTEAPRPDGVNYLYSEFWVSSWFSLSGKPPEEGDLKASCLNARTSTVSSRHKGAAVERNNEVAYTTGRNEFSQRVRWLRSALEIV
ncbi:unnamed protein product [Pleuronectes platessa]|uniref:Uncharacterized protein n=1 Tax=Pleuronectes platessa TaxID=8262 RepID=A0A9N7Z3G9_PLEPL|nr:unnamed protein product [Pleuronectes platessa]